MTPKTVFSIATMEQQTMIISATPEFEITNKELDSFEDKLSKTLNKLCRMSFC
jgi:hypothetical protein